MCADTALAGVWVESPLWAEMQLLPYFAASR